MCNRDTRHLPPASECCSIVDMQIITFGKVLLRNYSNRSRVIYGQALADSGAVTALIDTSDGLSLSLYELSKSSNCGFYLQAAALPISEEAIGK